MLVRTVLPSPIGRLAVAATPAGIARLSFEPAGPERSGESVGEASDGAALAHLERAAEQLALYFAGRLRKFDLALDLEGTPFQRAVWDLLLAIRYGETRTYEDLARALARPGASRAVGAASGANPVAIVVPCHRVIAKDGTLGGYGGGLDRKRALLRLEGALPAPERRRPLGFLDS